jgi:hypothetical protein
MEIPFVVFGKEYTSYTWGDVDKFVHCEKCGTDYVYRAFRNVVATAMSLYFLENQGASERAQERAQNKLDRTLESAVEPVPCPSCGRFQKDMVREARRRHLRWMSPRGAAGIFMCYCFFAFIAIIVNGVAVTPGPAIPGKIFFPILGVLLGLIMLLPYFRVILANRFSPNRLSPEERLKKRFFSTGILRSEYDKRKAEERQAVELAQKTETKEKLKTQVLNFLSRPVPAGTQPDREYLKRYSVGAPMTVEPSGYSLETSYLLASSGALIREGAAKEYHQELAELLKAIMAETEGRWPRTKWP